MAKERVRSSAAMRSDLLPAARVCVSVIVPIAIAAASNRLDLALFGMFGAMASIYGRRGTHVDRLLMQASAGSVLVVAVTAGVATAAAFEGPWWAAAGVGLVAGAAAEVSDGRAWAPPGALFAVFAYGACAAVPAGWADVTVALLVSAAAAAFAVLVGGVGVVHAGTRRLGRTRVALPGRPSGVRRRAYGAAVAASTAFVLATALGSPHAYWAAVAGVVPLTQANSSGGLRRAGQRLVGTIGGLFVAAPLLALDMGIWVAVCCVAVLQLLTELVVTRHYAVAMLFVTPMALLMTYLGTNNAEGLLLDRGATTLLGVLVGVVVILAQHDRRSDW